MVFFKENDQYIKLASLLIKNLPVPLGTLVRKKVRLKLAAFIIIQLHRLLGCKECYQGAHHPSYNLFYLRNPP
jgi:hypothetical protein